MVGNRRPNSQIGPWMRYNTPMTFPFQHPGFPAGGLPISVPYLPYHHIPYKQPPRQQPKRTSAVDNDLARIMSRPQKEQKQMIGEKIFAAIENRMGKIKEAGKITGMLLEMNSQALINLLRQPRLLHERVLQASEVLRKFQQESSEKALE